MVKQMPLALSEQSFEDALSFGWLLATQMPPTKLLVRMANSFKWKTNDKSTESCSLPKQQQQSQSDKQSMEMLSSFEMKTKTCNKFSPRNLFFPQSFEALTFQFAAYLRK